MRAWIVAVALLGCSDHRRESERRSEVAVPVASSKPHVARIPHAVDRLVDRSICVAPGAWAGTWDGRRPFDESNAFAHRGPTRVTITDELHFSEGVGAAGYQVDLAVDGNVAYGDRTTTQTHGSVALETGQRSELTITKEVAVAACFDAKGHLHVWRILGASGVGIQTTHEEDEVVLVHVPVRPVVPPPKGFTVLAEDARPDRLVLSHDDVIWSDTDGNVPAISTIRAVPRKGGATRELASGIPFIHALAVHGDYVYFAGQETIGRVPLAGGKVETLVDNVTAMSLAVDDKTLAFTDLYSVLAAPLAGGTPRRLYEPKDAQIAALAIDGGSIYAAVRPIELGEEGTVVRVRGPGEAPVRLAKLTVCGDDGVTRGGGWLLATCDGSVVRIDEHAGGAARLVKDLEDVASIAVSGSTTVYALGAGRGLVGASTGGKQRTLVEGDFDPEQVVVDPAEPKTIYVIDRGVDLDNPHGRIGTIAL